jgi:ribosomal protein S27E
MLKVECPNCGAEVVFRSAGLPARICDYCRTMIVRSGEGVSAIGKAAELPFDVSPIQLGTSGRFGDHGFEVIGRVRWGWTDGSWNEWLLLFDDGSKAWLGEAMGQYMLLRERPLDELRAQAIRTLAQGGEVPVGTEAQVDGEILIVSDAREVVCIAAEGELPFTAPAGWTIFSVDFRSASGRCASLQRDGATADFYDGRYVTLAELKPTNLRDLEGWTAPAFAA